jgi:hypothetical protein
MPCANQERRNQSNPNSSSVLPCQENGPSSTVKSLTQGARSNWFYDTSQLPYTWRLTLRVLTTCVLGAYRLLTRVRFRRSSSCVLGTAGHCICTGKKPPGDVSWGPTESIPDIFMQSGNIWTATKCIIKQRDYLQTYVTQLCLTPHQFECHLAVSQSLPLPHTIDHGIIAPYWSLLVLTANLQPSTS